MTTLAAQVTTARAGRLGRLARRQAEQILAQVAENERVDLRGLLDYLGADLGVGLEQHGLDVAGPGFPAGDARLEIAGRGRRHGVGVGDEL